MTTETYTIFLGDVVREPGEARDFDVPPQAQCMQCGMQADICCSSVRCLQADTTVEVIANARCEDCCAAGGHAVIPLPPDNIWRAKAFDLAVSVARHGLEGIGKHFTIDASLYKRVAI